MYQFICFIYHVHFQTYMMRGGDVRAAKSNAGWVSVLYFLPFAIWMSYVLEPVAGTKTALENVWRSWWGGRFDPRLGPMFLFTAPLFILLYRFCITRRHNAIVMRFSRVKLPRPLPFFFVDFPLALAMFALAAAADPWPLQATLGMIALWLLVEISFRAWLKQNTFSAKPPAPAQSD